MKLCAGTTEEFRADARMHRIAEKLRAEYTTQIGHRPARSEVASWQNSVMARMHRISKVGMNATSARATNWRSVNPRATGERRRGARR